MEKLMKLVILPCLVLVFVSCAYRKLLKSEDCKVKYDAGMKYFEAGKCNKAYPLLEGCIPYFRGGEEFANIIFALAECDIQEGNYDAARERYKYLSTLYSGTPIEEKALYKYAVTSYMLAGPHDLDSKSIVEAASVLDVFLSRFPKSKYADTIRTYKEELQKSLYLKEFEIAKLYFDIEDYKAAKTSFMNLIEDYSHADISEEVYYYLLKSAYMFAYNSSPQKQRERYQDFINLYDTYVRNIKKESFRKELRDMYDRANNFLRGASP